MSKRRDKHGRKARGGARRVGSASSAGPTRSYLTNLPADQKVSANMHAWPIVRAYVPAPDAWRVTGCGTVGVVRQRPDGKWSTAYLNIELLQGGVLGMFGKDDADPADEDDFLRSLAEMVPPFVPGDADLAARYAFGAYAWSEEGGYTFPPEGVRRYLGLFPRLSGTRHWWLQQFTGENGLVPRGLAEVVESNPTPDDVPEGKEIVILTEAVFELGDPIGAIEKLGGQSPEFGLTEGGEGDAAAFSFTRAYPKDHWSPLKFLGGRQSLGDLRIEGGPLAASAKVLSMMTRLIARLKAILGTGPEVMRLKEARWRGAHDLEWFRETFT